MAYAQAISPRVSLTRISRYGRYRTSRIATGADRAAQIGRGMVQRVIGILVVCALAACQSPAVEAPSRAQLADEVLRTSPPDSDDTTCWAAEVTPAIIETVSEQTLVTPEIRDATGQVVTPASFRSTTKQRIVQDRDEVWFRTPCPAEMTVDFIATLQRALKARGLYRAPLTGVLDAATAEAIRRFQADRGLDSRQLSLAAARELGIVSADLDTL